MKQPSFLNKGAVSGLFLGFLYPGRLGKATNAWTGEEVVTVGTARMGIRGTVE